MRLFITWLTVVVLFSPVQLAAAELRLAVASNFKEAMVLIVADFEAHSEHEVTLIPGSTGKHYAQIKNGAPFDLFFAADAVRPEQLEKEGAAVQGSRFTYAIGRLVLWSPRPDYVDSDGGVLMSKSYRYLAIANPRLAPYGLAAKEVLQSLELWQQMRGRMVRGENIAQAYQFVKSGNAEMGFVAYSQLKQRGEKIEGSWWLVPQALYTRIEQQAVILKDSEAARAFVTFIKSPEALKIIADVGYDTP